MNEGKIKAILKYPIGEKRIKYDSKNGMIIISSCGMKEAGDWIITMNFIFVIAKRKHFFIGQVFNA